MHTEKGKSINIFPDTSEGTIGALTAVAASSPFRAPTTASAISIATPSWKSFSRALITIVTMDLKKCLSYPKVTHLSFSSTGTKMRCCSNELMQNQLAVFRWRLLSENIKCRLKQRNSTIIISLVCRVPITYFSISLK